MKCPNCESTQSKVKDTRMLKNENVRMRRHRCDECEFRFTTWETTGPAPLKLQPKGWLHLESMPFMGKVS